MSKRKLATTSLQISEKERAVFRILLGSVEHFQLGTCVRIAGGWVRDKAPRSAASVAVTAAEVLGRSSDDLDVAVDNMSGEQFANKVHESLRLAVSTAYMERVLNQTVFSTFEGKLHVFGTDLHRFAHGGSR